MGFLSDVFNTLAPLAQLGSPAQFLAPPQRGSSAPLATQPRARPVTRAAVAAPAGQQIAAAGGNGATHRVTIVQSIDNNTGAVLREEVMPGSPFLMNKDFETAKRVFKMISAANTKLPRKVVKQSEITVLKNEVVKDALRNATHHHNGNGAS